jgi:YVTN family beta-propeller protein
LVAVVVLTSAFVVPTIPGSSTAHRTAIASVVPSSSATAVTGDASSLTIAGAAGDLAGPALSSASAGSVVRTMFPGFNTSLPGSFTSSVSAWQVGSPTYVPSTDTLWFPQRSVVIPGYPVPTIAPVAVYNLSTGGFDELVTNLSNASALAYDPGNGYVYATLPASNSVAVVNPRTGAVVDHSIPVGSAPDALAVDPNANQLFVANSGSSNVTVIDTVENTVSFPSVPVGADPVSLAFDPQDKLVFVANAETSAVSVINATNLTQSLPIIKLVNGPASTVAYSSQSDTVVATVPSSKFATIISAFYQAPITQVIPVGKGVVPATVSANGTEFIVGNSTRGDLVILNSSIGTPIGTPITIDGNATQLVLDPQSGLVFCWTSSGRVLESVNLYFDAAKQAAPTTSPELLSMSSLAAQSRVFVSSANGSLIYGLNSIRLGQASPAISAAFVPLSVAADPANDRLYVGTSNGLYVYNASSDKLNATGHGLSGNCSQLVLDRPDNLLWLANNRVVDAVNLTTLNVEIPTGLLLPSGSTQGIAVDPVDGETFVLNSSSTVRVLTSLSGVVVAPGISAGANLTSLAYDPADGQVYAAGDGVTLVNGVSLAVDGGTLPLGGPHRVLGEVYEPSRKDIYIASTGLLPGKQGMVTALDGSSVAASEASAVEIAVGETPDAFGVVTSGSNDAHDSAMVWVANELSGTISVISSPPQITYFAASPPVIDLGYPTSIILAFEGGAGPSTVAYYGLPVGCFSSDESELNCTPTTAGNFTIAVNVTDSLGSWTNVTTTLTVVGSLSIQLLFSLPTYPDLDVGVPLVLSASVSGGLPPYSYQWTFGDGTAASGPNASHTYSTPGDFLLTAEVRDLTGATDDLSIVIIVVSAPTVAVFLSPGSVTDVAVPVSLNATVSGGTGASQEKWTFDDGTEAVGPNTSHAWTRPGNYTVTFAYTDALGVTANRSVEVTVHPSLVATFSAGNASSSDTATPGSLVDFSSNISGGTPPYLESWSFGDGSYANGLSVNHSYASAGTYSVKVTLSDAVGGSVGTNLSVTVAASSSSSGGVVALSGGFASGLFLGLVLGGVAAAVVLVVAGLRKGGRPPSGPPTPYVPP